MRSMADMDQRPNLLEDRELFFWLALYMAPGVGPRLFQGLVERFKTPESVLGATAAQLGSVTRLPAATVEALVRFDWRDRVEAELTRAMDMGYRLITLRDSAYPARLREIWDPPPVIWVDGDFKPGDHAAVALVGSRAATEHGRETSRRLAAELTSLGVTVISGGAAGIDTAAHQGALAAGGRTVAVLGCGLDIVYPPANRNLFQRVARSGAVISEYPLGTQPKPGHFPRRNRIISGLSAAVVVVEASSTSGAIITARLALEQNREVLAVPGRALALRNRGAHDLIRQGARLVETGRDILEEIRPQLEPVMSPRRGTADPEPARQPQNGREVNAVLSAIGDEAVHMDIMCRKLGWSPSQLAPILLDLELKGQITQLPGRRYRRVV